MNINKNKNTYQPPYSVVILDALDAYYSLLREAIDLRLHIYSSSSRYNESNFILFYEDLDRRDERGSLTAHL